MSVKSILSIIFKVIFCNFDLDEHIYAIFVLEFDFPRYTQGDRHRLSLRCVQAMLDFNALIELILAVGYLSLLCFLVWALLKSFYILRFFIGIVAAGSRVDVRSDDITFIPSACFLLAWA